MQRFSSSVKTKQLRRSTTNINRSAAQQTALSIHSRSQLGIPEVHYEAPSTSILPSYGKITEELDHIQNYLHEISAHMEFLHAIIGDEQSNISYATELKRKLKTAHRGLERFQAESCKGLGEEIKSLITFATRHAWQSYRSMVTFEERLRNLESRENLPPLRRESDNDKKSMGTSSSTKKTYQQHGGVYIPTGARNHSKGATRPRTMLQPSVDLRQRQQKRDTKEPVEDMSRVSSALPLELNLGGPVQAPDRDTASIHGSLAKVLTYDNPFPSNPPHFLPQTAAPKPFPQPSSASVKLRLHHSEASQTLALDDPDTMRLGSCTGSTITAMIMSGIKDPRFVLPSFAYIKHHEVRALKAWLTARNYVTRTPRGRGRGGGISRMEKVLHCIHLLQTGCRYESLAVMFSRSPRQVKESCWEVMMGLLQLHCVTSVDGDEAATRVGEMHRPLWGLWRKYDGDDDDGGLKGNAAAVVYYGFRTSEVVDVLAALNIYIGRWRMQGEFALDGLVFNWGWMFVGEVVAGAKKGLGDGNSGELGILGVGCDDDDDGGDDVDDGTSTICAVDMAGRICEMD